MITAIEDFRHSRPAYDSEGANEDSNAAGRPAAVAGGPDPAGMLSENRRKRMRVSQRPERHVFRWRDHCECRPAAAWISERKGELPRPPIYCIDTIE